VSIDQPSQSFDGEDRILLHPFLIELHHLLPALGGLVGLVEDVLPLLPHLARGDVQGEIDVLARLQAGLHDGVHDQVDRFDVRLEARGEPALVADGGVVPLLLEDPLQGMEDLGPHPQGLGEVLGVHRDDHELLKIDVVVGVPAAVEDVHHRHRQDLRVRTAKIAVEREFEFQGCGARDRHGDAEDRVRPQLRLVRRAVELDHEPVDADLVERVESGDVLGQDRVHVLDRVQDPLAAVAHRVTVPEFDGLVLAGGGAAGHRRTADHAGFKFDIDFDRGVAAGIEDFTCSDIDDCAHGGSKYGEK
jgi:hypothetical protein